MALFGLFGGGSNPAARAQREVDRQNNLDLLEEQTRRRIQDLAFRNIDSIFGIKTTPKALPAGTSPVDPFVVNDPRFGNSLARFNDATKLLPRTSPNEGAVETFARANFSPFGSNEQLANTLKADPGFISFLNQSIPNVLATRAAGVNREAELNKAAIDSRLSGLGSEVFNFFNTKLNRQKETAQRRGKFQLARQGLLGSSAQNDLNANIQDRFLQGVTDINSRVNTARTAARNELNRQRSLLQNRLLSGESSDSVIRDAGNALGSSLATAFSDIAQRPLQDFFTGANTLFTGISTGIGQQQGDLAALANLINKRKTTPTANGVSFSTT